jgi:radical SAM superfamily enzyme YgiQ (UPF0313 family)
MQKNSDHEVKIIDFHKSSFEESKKVIEKENPDVIGVNCLTMNRMNSIELTKIAKEVNPDIKTILGGHHAHFMYEQILNNFPSVDYVVFSEGEVTMNNLVDNFDRAKNVKGIAFKNDGSIINTGMRDLANLDELPFPCYDDIDLNKYLGIKPFEKDRIRTDVISSRGCKYACQFCNEIRFWRGWRMRSAKNVVDEIEWLQKTEDVEFVFFADDIFSVDEKRVIDICKEILDRKLGIKWWCETRVDCVTERMLKWLEKAGCLMVEYGVESGSQKILDNINKRITIEQIRKAFKMTKKTGMLAEFLFMVGNPGETWDTIEETKMLISEIEPDFLIGSITYVYPATALYEIAKRQDVVDDEFWLSDKLPPMYTGEHTIEELTAMYFSVLKHYYASKGRIEFLKFGINQFFYNPRNVAGYAWRLMKKKVFR